MRWGLGGTPRAGTAGAEPRIGRGIGWRGGETAGFLLDLDRCVGCGACVVACRNENHLGPKVQWRRLAAFNPRRDPWLPTWHLSLACHHCRRPPCVRACPSGALEKRRDGVVWLDREVCLGCRYCEMACPFCAPAYEPDAGVMTKCHLCLPRLTEGLEPACVAACPTEALLPVLPSREPPPGLDRAAPVPGVRDPVGAEPSLWVVLPERGRRGEMAARWDGIRTGSPQPSDPPRSPCPSPPASPFHEVPLVVFSALVVAGAGLGGSPLVRWVFEGGGGGSSLLWQSLSQASAVAAALALGSGTLLSLRHLGQPRRAWRALRGLGRSALSTEVAVVGGAFLSSLGAAVWPPTGFAGGLAGILAPLLCLLALLSLGWVYRFEHQYAWKGWAAWQPLVQGALWGWVASMLLSTVHYGGAAPGVASVSGAGGLPFWVLMALDTMVFWTRGVGEARDAGAGSPTHPTLWEKRKAIWSARALFGTVLPLGAALGGWWGWVLVFLSVAVGVERFAFYALGRRWTPEGEVSLVGALAQPVKVGSRSSAGRVSG